MNTVMKFKGKSYEINEVTIEQWGKLSSLKEMTEDIEFTTLLMAEMTGLSKEDIENADWQEVLRTSQLISQSIIEDSKKFYNEFVFDNIKYGFIDLPNLTFGEFIDIDSYLTKPEQERRRDLNLLMAFLYREIGKDGKLVKYDSSTINDRAEKFKKLPVKYANGATNFFLRIGKISPDNLVPYSSNQSPLILKMKMIWILLRLIVSAGIGVGLVLLSHYRTRISQRLGRLLATH